MIKVVTTLKKRADISRDEFRNYYENHHRLLGEKYLSGYARRYVRRYPDPMPGDEDEDSDFDVLLEIWFADEAALAACGAHLAEPAIAAEIAADEEKLFDRARKRSFILHECESDIWPASPDVSSESD